MSQEYFSSLISPTPFLLSGAKTRSISAENPKGEVGQGGKEASNLGPGRKGRPCIMLPKGEKVSLAEIEGTGIIQHIWITVRDKTEKGPYVLRDLVLRMFWDGEDEPSVETPLSDFFCIGHAIPYKVNSLPVAVNPTGGMNSYFPMPFKSSARITVENQHPADIEGFFYQITYSLLPRLPENVAYLHAQWRRENPTEIGKDYTILDGAKGKGQYIGTFLAIASLHRYWWGEGEVKFYIDGDREYPTICGTGTEDYAGGAWCFGDTYSTPFLGYPLCLNQEDGPTLHALYRWHLPDPIYFEKSLKVTLQQIGHDGRALFERSDDVASAAYWYQTEPHASFPALLPAPERWPR